MLNLSGTQRYFLYGGQADMRKGFDSLCGIVRDEFKMDPLGGDVFVFFSRGHNRIKLLQWQGDGYALYFKRLEKGTFEVPDNLCQITSRQLMFILEGVRLSSVKFLKRYHHFAVNNTISSGIVNPL